eukprot:3068145-Alexandrium_andersonii.AAC.1
MQAHEHADTQAREHIGREACTQRGKHACSHAITEADACTRLFVQIRRKCAARVASIAPPSNLA